MDREVQMGLIIEACPQCGPLVDAIATAADEFVRSGGHKDCFFGAHPELDQIHKMVISHHPELQALLK